MRALVLYNTFSGNSRFIKRLDYIAKSLKTKYDIVDFYKSEYMGSNADYIRLKGSVYDLLVCVGGDGTVHEVINAVMKLDRKPKLAYIPAGTCNDAARSLGLRRNIKKTIKTILKGCSAKMDLFKINDEYFMYGLAAGCLTEISYDTGRGIKKNIGKFAYYLQGLKSYVDTKTINITIETNGQEISGDFSLMLALNTRYLAGFRINRKQRIYLNDSKIRVTLIKKTTKLVNIFDFGMFLIFGERYKHNIINFDSEKFVVKSNQLVAYNTDGEMFGKHNLIDVSCVPLAIELITTRRVFKRHFISNN